MARILTIRLKDDDLDRLTEEARRRKIPTSTLARSLLLGALEQRRPHRVAEDMLEALESSARLRYRLSRVLVALPQEPD